MACNKSPDLCSFDVKAADKVVADGPAYTYAQYRILSSQVLFRQGEYGILPTRAGTLPAVDRSHRHYATGRLHQERKSQPLERPQHDTLERAVFTN